ncbi:hypothetical protein CHLNCDRAFT_136745 [Chlorella variabilis]|uniref:FAS1 domain-containing protein n=1 Tax=Chlorella variabilis TaxID=554065 RepID=E1ZKZ6_CHLVA|nr:hypothetical protein CHLNCDRAFT_136745 [Chlorella variabilis]EFN53471.1 hypothetical protein CHLNCDRAFT_136745 [Chlorella variabilis]|eukprot:XP_005845573.1 hypothetical protein CHLNCDRAFT_136745 [Chlorella variabilis]
MARSRHPSQAMALALALAAACLLLPASAQGRVLAQEQPNPFLAAPTAANGSPAGPAAATAAAPPPLSEVVATPFPPALPAPAPEAPAAPAPDSEPTAEAPAPAGRAVDPCACTATGLSGGVNTTRVGCGQWDIVSGSAAFTCFVADPPRCTPAGGAPLAPSTKFSGAATRVCSAQEAAPYLPTVSRLIVGTPQLVSFASALRQANLSSVPGQQVTIFAPSNQAFNTAVYSGRVSRQQLQDPTFLRQLVLAAIVPQRLTASDLVAAGTARAAGGQQLPVTSQLAGKLRRSGQTLVGSAGPVLPDLLASTGVIHIAAGFVALPAEAAVATAPAAEAAIAPVDAPLPAAPPRAESHPSTSLTSSAPRTAAFPLPTASDSLAHPSPTAGALPTARPGTTGLLSGSDLASQLTGGCACTTTGRSGGVQTGQAGCARRIDSNFLLPVSLCYVQSPATCLASLQSTAYPGAAWKLC